MRKISIASINSKYRESNDEDNNKNNDENIYDYTSPYTSYGTYNCERGATTARPRH